MTALKQLMDRRASIKWILAAASSLALLERPLLRGESPAPAAAGYGPDPDLLRDYRPGDLWPLTFDPVQKRTVTALCDLIIPADAKSPAASAVGVPLFIDEWISAPYPVQIHDRATVLGGLQWIEAESRRRFNAEFSTLVQSQQTAICDDICFLPEAKPEHQEAALFFKLFRDLTAAGFYTTPTGWTDLGYIGNTPSATFAGPPPEVLAKLGLD